MNEHGEPIEFEDEKPMIEEARTRAKSNGPALDDWPEPEPLGGELPPRSPF
jgi:hypothetical protein